MLKDFDFSNLTIISATKNITDLYDTKTYIITVNLVNTKNSVLELTGIERLVKEFLLRENNDLIKISCSYVENDNGQVMLPIKILYKNKDEKYSVKALYESDLTPQMFEDLTFINELFESTPIELKRLYM